MGPIRDQIDALDRDIVALLAKRQELVHQAGSVKPHRDDVIDEARIDEVIRHIGAAADACGLSRAIAEPLWRHLIDLSIAYEFSVFDSRN